MKKLYLGFLTLCMGMFFCSTSQAQTVNKGAWMIGGHVNFDSEKEKDADASATYLEISPAAAYFIMDNLAVGLGVSYAKYSFDGEEILSTTSLTPGVRYYVYDAVFAQLQYSLGLGDGDNNAFTASAGYSWFLNNSVAIEPALNFSLISGDDDYSASNFGLSIGVQAFIGRN